MKKISMVVGSATLILGCVAGFGGLVLAQSGAAPAIFPLPNTEFGAEYTPTRSALTPGDVYRLQLDSQANLETVRPAEVYSSTAPATAAFTTPPFTVVGGGYFDYFLNLSGMSGSYSGCNVQEFNSADGTNWGQTWSGAPSMGDGVQILLAHAAIVGAYVKFSFACSSYGTAGSAMTSVVYH